MDAGTILIGVAIICVIGAMVILYNKLIQNCHTPWRTSVKPKPPTVVHHPTWQKRKVPQVSAADLPSVGADPPMPPCKPYMNPIDRIAADNGWLPLTVNECMEIGFWDSKGRKHQRYKIERLC